MNKCVQDMMGRTVKVPTNPIRIVSLVPSQTELLYDLGLGERVVGITKFCIHPSIWFREKQRVGGTKNVNFDVIRSLNPDLIIGNKEENTREDIEALAQEYPVWMSDIVELEDALAMITAIGSITNTSAQAHAIVHYISVNFSNMKSSNIAYKCAYLIWRDPIMVAGNNTFIDKMLAQCGFNNVFRSEQRYATTTVEELQNLSLDYLFLSSEPYPFSEKHIAEFGAILPNTKVLLVDGEYFSWYGSRLISAPTYFQQLLAAL